MSRISVTSLCRTMKRAPPRSSFVWLSLASLLGLRSRVRCCCSCESSSSDAFLFVGQLWKVPFKGGPPVRLTKNGGIYAIESDDGRFLYYSKFTQPGIWKMPLNGGEEILVLDQPAGLHWYNWALTRNGIHFLTEDPLNGKIKFFDFATGKTISIFVLESPSGTSADWPCLPMANRCSIRSVSPGMLTSCW
jgi:hypothetical protein